MNKHNVLIAVFLSVLLAPVAAIFSQVEEDSLNRKANRLLMLPSHLIDPINPTIQLGFEKGVGQHHAIQMLGG